MDVIKKKKYKVTFKKHMMSGTSISPLLRKKIKNSFTKLRQVCTVLIAIELLAGDGRCNNGNCNYKIILYGK